MKPVTRRKPAATRTTAVRQPASTVKAAAAREPVRAALDRRIAKRRGSEPSSLAKAIVARHPSSRPAPVAKTGRRFGQLDFKKANAARKEQARCRR